MVQSMEMLGPSPTNALCMVARARKMSMVALNCVGKNRDEREGHGLLWRFGNSDSST